MKRFKVYVNGEPFEVLVDEGGAASGPAVPPAARPAVPHAAARPVPPQRPSSLAAAPLTAVPAAAAPKSGSAAAGAVTAPMPGNIVGVKVKPGDQVKAGQVVVVLEAMKMENEITAPVDGTVKEVAVKEGQTVQSGEPMVVLG